MQFPATEELERDLQGLTDRLNNPAIRANASQIKQVAKEARDKEYLLGLLKEYDTVRRELVEIGGLLASPEADIRALAEQDQPQLREREQGLIQKIEAALIPADPRDARDVILEIRAGAGGEEAALFAQELFRAYTRYAENAGWAVHVVSRSDSQETGGFKEVVAEVSAPLRSESFAGQISGPFGTLKFERGVHRVQRIPKTEKQGRVHTSTVTVAVLPQVEETEIEIRSEDLKVDTYRASGAGGQHVNKTSSAVRVTHLPTNTVVAVQDERSQHKNRDKAMKILRARISEAQEEERAKKEAAERKSQVGTGDRSEKIRTYNFPQDRITDHRIKQSWGNIAGIMEGEFLPLFKDLREAERQQKFAT